MKSNYYPSINAKCSMCKCELTDGGYLILDNKDNIIETLCTICKETNEEINEVTKLKKKKLIVRRATGSLGLTLLTWIYGRHYHVISSKNLLFKDSNILTEAEVITYLDDPSIDLEVRG